MTTKRLTRMALLTALALIIFMVEAQLPPLAPIPGIKLGMANIITIYAMFRMGAKDTFLILLGRILLGAVFAGQLMTLFYSLSGGILCYLTMLVLRRLVTEKQLWVASVFGAISHNIGQILAAIAIAGTPELVVYLPVLLISGVITGLFTGLCAQFVVNRMDRIHPV